MENIETTNNMENPLDMLLSGLMDRHRQMDNLMALTKEMGSVIEMNDLDSLGAVLSMRQKTMEKVDDIHMMVVKTIKRMDPMQRDKLKLIMKQEIEAGSLDDPVETGIFNTNRTTLLLLQSIIELDDAINKRIRSAIAPCSQLGQ